MTTAAPLNFLPDIRTLTAGPTAIHFDQLSQAEAARQAKFFDVLFKKVICQQLLPKALGPVSRLFTFAWKPDPQQAAYAEIQIKMKPGAFNARWISHDDAEEADMLLEPLYSVDCRLFTARMRSPVHVKLFACYGLLAQIFSRKYEEVEFGFVPKSETTLAHPSWATFRLTTTFKRFTNVPDILAAMLADGLDLTSLQPFLGGLT